jgi:DNA helicase-2/ATP-dependent DNA helicase PcrA
MFDICPLHYKAKVIFKIPTPSTFVQSFGISLHNSLYRFYKEIKEGQDLNQNDLQKILLEEWVSEGYINKKHEEERLMQARETLNKYYNEEFDRNIIPIALETPISFSLKNGVKVFGKIDRIDKNKDGIEIIDYKTGQDNPKAESSHILQLSMYALAATRIKDNIFNVTPDKIKLTLHFIEGNTKKTLTFTKSDLDDLENNLIEKIDEIEKSDFKCSGSILCKTCEFKLLCNTIR